MARKQVRDFNRGAVLASLTMIKPALGKGMFVPILSHFCFDGERAFAYDDSIAICVPLATPFSCAIPGDLMLRLLETMVAEEMDMEMADGAIRVQCGKSTMKLPMLADTAFLFKPNALDKKTALGTFDITEQFVEGMQSCLLAVGNDPTHPAQMGLTLRTDKRTTCLYSTDNVTMSEYLLFDDSAEGEFLPDDGVIFPTEFCRQLVALKASIKGVATLTVNKDSAVVRFADAADVLLFGKLIAVERALDFPTVFDRMIPNTKPELYTVPPAWDAAFTRASVVVNPAHPVTKVSSGDACLRVESKSPIGEVVDTVEFEEDGDIDCKSFLIDPQHVIRASKLCSRVSFQAQAMVLHGGTRFTHLISHCAE